VIIEFKLNLFYFIVDVSATSVAFVEMTSGSDFLEKMTENRFHHLVSHGL